MANKKNTTWFSLAIAAVAVVALGYIFIDNGNSASVTAVQNSNVQMVSESQTDDAKYPAAPDFTLNNLDGQEVRLSDLKGKVVFVNFWATWCGPCKMEIPHFVELIDQYEDDGFTILGIAVDPREFSRVPTFADQMGINYPILLDNKGVSGLYGGIRSIPTTFVINKNGKVVERIVGARSKADFERMITNWL